MSRRRAWEYLGAVAGIGLAVLIVRVLLPSRAPNGIVLEGALVGLRLALVAAALYVVWQSSRILNFAQIALAVVAPTVFFDVGALGIVGIGALPWVVSLLLGLAFGTVFAGLIEVTFVRRFFTAPRLVLTLVTIVAAPVVGSLAGKFTSGLPLFAHDQRYRFLVLHQDRFQAPFASWGWSVFPLRVGFVQVLDAVLSIGALVGLSLFLRRSRTGAALVGSSENPDRALLLGINVRRLSTLAWALAGFLGSLYGVLDGMDFHSYGGSGTSSSEAVVALTVPLVGLALGRMTSLSVAALTCVGLSILNAGLSYAYPSSEAFPVVLLVVLVGAMFRQRTRYSRDDRGLTAGAETAKEQRPTPPVLAALPGVRLLRRGAIALGALIVLVFPYVVTISTARTAALSLIVGVLVMSLTVITGWGGLVSLGQVAIASVGGVVYANLVGSAHWPFLLAMPAAIVTSAAVSLAVGQPALRLRGPFLPVITLVFAVAVEAVLFASPLTKHIVPATIPYPHLPFFSLQDGRHYYYFCLIAATLVAYTVRKLRVGRIGRVLVAIREDEYGVQPFGISAGRSRIAVFVLSGGIAGLGGVLLTPLLGVNNLIPTSGAAFPAFNVSSGIELVVVALVGGTTSVLGGMVAAIYFGGIVLGLVDPNTRTFATNTGLAVLLFINPGGMSAMLFALRDALLRIVALRRRMLVPGLLREIDLAALRGGRAPLTPASDTRGLASLGPHQRYARPSALYPTTGLHDAGDGTALTAVGRAR